MAELEKDATVPKSPIAIANFSSTVEGESWFIKLLTCCPCSGTPREAKMLDVFFHKISGAGGIFLGFKEIEYGLSSKHEDTYIIYIMINLIMKQYQHILAH